MNAYGGIENMHNNYATWTSMFSHVHEIKNDHSWLSFRRVIQASSWMVVGYHQPFPNSSTLIKKYLRNKITE